MALQRAKFKDIDLIQPLLSNQFHVIDIESKFSLPMLTMGCAQMMKEPQNYSKI